jgi:hypothetical protein
MKLYELAYACRLYEQGDSATFDNAYCEIRDTLGQKPDLASTELLKFLNKWGCRIDKKNFNKLKEKLQQWWAENQCNLPDNNIRDLNDNEREQIESAYRALLTYGEGLHFKDTAAAKTLHALRPDTLPMWDANIKDWFIADKGGKTYSDFVRYVAVEELSELEEDVKRLGFSLNEVPQLVHADCKVSLVKLVDEFHWVTKTVGHGIPTREQAEKWLSWMPHDRS